MFFFTVCQKSRVCEHASIFDIFERAVQTEKYFTVFCLNIGKN